MFDQKMLDTAPVGKEWVTIDGLGKVLLEADPEYQTLPAQEKYKEIEETLKRLSGEEDALDLCRAAHYEYLTDPNEWTREALRKAYEAVPEHKRMYLQGKAYLYSNNAVDFSVTRRVHRFFHLDAVSCFLISIILIRKNRK